MWVGWWGGRGSRGVYCAEEAVSSMDGGRRWGLSHAGATRWGPHAGAWYGGWYKAGMEAGMEVGVEAGMEVGVKVGIKVGMEVGVQVGMEVGYGG